MDATKKDAKEPKCKHGKSGGCGEKDWKRPCVVCGAKPTVCSTQMCGPCTFGEAETAGGNW